MDDSEMISALGDYAERIISAVNERWAFALFCIVIILSFFIGLILISIL